MTGRRVTIFVGHYGSGKTSVAVNHAFYLREAGKAVTIADLDIVNPYFRTSDHLHALEARGIRLVASPFAGSNVDLPALPGELYALVEDRACCAVFDVGGDDRGAVALGRYAPAIRAEGDYEMAFVVNFFRPLTRTPEDALAVLREVEAACGIPCTGLVHNSNLGARTTARDVLDARPNIEALAEAAGLPVLATAFDRRLQTELEDRVVCPFPLDLPGRGFDRKAEA